MGLVRLDESVLLGFVFPTADLDVLSNCFYFHALGVPVLLILLNVGEVLSSGLLFNFANQLLLSLHELYDFLVSLVQIPLLVSI